MFRKIYIIPALLLMFSLLACGPKPKTSVEYEPLTRKDLHQEPINRVAFYHYMNGVIAEIEENYELALSYYSTALKHAPESYDVRVALANLRMGLREYDKALEILMPLEDIYSEAVLMKADCQRALGNWPEATRLYNLAIRLDPEEISPHWYLGNYYRQAGEYGKAIEHYIIMSHLSESVQIYNELAQLYFNTGDTANAIKTYQSSVVVDGSVENRDGYMELARLLNMTGQADSAQIVLEKYIKLSSGSIDARLSLIETFISAENYKEAQDEIEKLATEYPNRSRLLGQLGMLSLDINQVETAKRLFTKQADLDKASFVPQYYLGRIAIFENEPEQAKQHFWNMIDLIDSIPDGWINLAEIYREQDSLEMAVDVLREGLERVSAGKRDIQVYLARYYAQLERYEAVINILEGVVDTSTADIALLFTIASAHERMGNFDSSVAYFERLLKVEPEFHPALNYLGYMLADLGIRLQESKDMIERALARDSLNPAYLDSYGWVLFKMGDLGQAEKYIKQAIDLMDNADAVIYDHLAEIYFAQGRVEDARRVWEQALALDPNNNDIREKLGR
jgi:tetratricopeptide (TPR) repeat protein